MDTGFDFKRDALRRINGNGKDDIAFAKACVGKMLNFAENKRIGIDQFGNYTKIATSSDLQGISDNLTAMNYVCSELRGFADFFKLKSDLFTIFDEARQSVEKDLEAAKDTAARAKRHIIAA